MSVCHPAAGRNTCEAKTQLPGSPPRRGLLSLRAAVIIAAGGVAAVATGALTCWASHSLAAAVLAGPPAFARTVEFLDRLIDEDAPAN